MEITQRSFKHIIENYQYNIFVLMYSQKTKSKPSQNISFSGHCSTGEGGAEGGNLPGNQALRPIIVTL